MNFLEFIADSEITSVPFYALVLVFTIFFVIFVHELGHYAMARFFQVRIQKFCLGFGQEIMGIDDSNGTRWALGGISLGGYVQIFGYVSPDNPQIWDETQKCMRSLTDDEKQIAFCFKPLWQRALIVSMGPIFNFVHAFLILTFVFTLRGQSFSPPVFTGIAKNTPAYEIGLLPHDRILSANGESVKKFSDFWKHIEQANEKALIEIERDGRILEKAITSQEMVYRDKKGIARSHGRGGAVYMMYLELDGILAINGIQTDGNEVRNREILMSKIGQLVEVELKITLNKTSVFLVQPLAEYNENLNNSSHEDYTRLYLGKRKKPFYVHEGFFSSAQSAVHSIQNTLSEALKFLYVVFFDKPEEVKVGGFGTLTEYTGTAVDKGFYSFFLFVAVFSIQIGFINLMPVPALDGGYLLFFLYEAIVGKPLSEKFQDYALSIGVVLLIGIMIIANISDVLRYLF